jgi:hypothetical protein
LPFPAAVRRFPAAVGPFLRAIEPCWPAAQLFHRLEKAMSRGVKAGGELPESGLPRRRG